MVLWVAVFLIGLFIVVSSTSAYINFESFQKDYPYIKKHTFYPVILIGLFLMFFGLEKIV